MTRPPAPVTAFAVALLGIAIFSAMDAVMKGLVLAIGAYTTMLWRTFAGAILSGILWARDPRWPGKAAMRLHLVRGALSTVMALTFFWGLARVPMAQAIALAFIAPLLSLFLASAILKEAIGARTVVASLVALGGVGVILAGEASADLGQEAMRGSLAVLGSAICYAFNIVLMRSQAQIAGPVEVTFFQSAIVGTLLALAVPWVGEWPPLAQAPMIVLAAVFATLSLLLLAWAYARGEASYLSATEYSSFLWASLFGFVIFGEAVSTYTLIGAALIIGGCIVAASGRPAPSVPDIEAAL